MGRARAKKGTEGRQKELNAMFQSFGDIGFDFKENLSAEELKDHARSLNLDIGECLKNKPYKGDYLFAVEAYYAQERRKAGKHPDDYLRPSFDCRDRTLPYIRQILTSHGIKFTTATKSEDRKCIGDLTSKDIHSLFAEKIDDMRADAGYVAPRPAPDPTFNRMVDAVGGFGIGGDEGAGAAGGRSGGAGNATLAPNSYRGFQAPAAGYGRAVADSRQQAGRMDLDRQPASAFSGFIARNKPTFGQSWQPSVTPSPPHGSGNGPVPFSAPCYGGFGGQEASRSPFGITGEATHPWGANSDRPSSPFDHPGPSTRVSPPGSHIRNNNGNNDDSTVGAGDHAPFSAFASSPEPAEEAHAGLGNRSPSRAARASPHAQGKMGERKIANVLKRTEKALFTAMRAVQTDQLEEAIEALVELRELFEAGLTDDEIETPPPRLRTPFTVVLTEEDVSKLTQAIEKAGARICSSLSTGSVSRAAHSLSDLITMLEAAS